MIPAIGREKAYYYIDQMHEWLESFGLGYKRDDPSTIREEVVPLPTATVILSEHSFSVCPSFIRKDLFRRTGRLSEPQVVTNHTCAESKTDLSENFTWGIRQEPAVVGTFEKIFGTEDLLVCAPSETV